jgi:Inner membrane protein YgaP-like, transmembrane domain
MNPLIAFLASTAGRILRVVAGIALIAWGIWGLGGTLGIIIAVIGAVPLLAGLFDRCVFAPLFGNPFKGADIRAG